MSKGDRGWPEDAKFAAAEFFQMKIEWLKGEVVREDLEPQFREAAMRQLENMLRAQADLKTRVGN